MGKGTEPQEKTRMVREGTERRKTPRRVRVRDAKRKGMEPQEKTRMVREGTERRITPRRRRMVRVAKRRGREPQEKTRMGRMVMERREKPRRTKRNLRKRMGAEMARARKTAIGQERMAAKAGRTGTRAAKKGSKGRGRRVERARTPGWAEWTLPSTTS